MKALALGMAATLMLAGAAQAAPARPDWSGVWAPVEGIIFDPTARNHPDNAGRDTYQMREYPPYNAEYEARYARIIESNRAGRPSNDPAARCLPLGMPRMIALYPVEFIIQPHRTTMLFEQYSQVRRIWTDGRKHLDDPDPGFVGDSIGRWEGDTLVVDTIGIRPDLTFDTLGTPHSDALHIVERIRKTDPDTIEDRITVDDPKAFTKPWVVTRHYKRQPDWRILEYVCDNNRNVPDENGVTTAK